MVCRPTNFKFNILKDTPIHLWVLRLVQRFRATTGHAVCSACWPAARDSTARRSTTPARPTCREGTSTARRQPASLQSTVDIGNWQVHGGVIASPAASIAVSAAVKLTARRRQTVEWRTSSTTAATRQRKNAVNCVVLAASDDVIKRRHDDSRLTAANLRIPFNSGASRGS